MLRSRFVLREREISSQLIEKNTVEKLSNISSDVSMNIWGLGFFREIKNMEKKRTIISLVK